MKVKISEKFKDKESIKSWVIIILILGIITLFAYYYGYPYVFNKIYEKTRERIIFTILYQIQETGKVKIGIGSEVLILIPEGKCNEIKG